MQYGMFVDGAFTATKESKTVKSPYDQEPVGEIGRASAADVERAIASAVRAAPVMAALPAWRRSEILLRARAHVEARKDIFARTLMEEAGKPIRYARAEVERCLDTLTDAADLARTLGGEILPLDAFKPGEGRVGLLKRVPAGPVTAISPFNFPLNLVAHKLAPSVACGCPVVLKPASQTPFSSMLLAEAFAEAGLPRGGLAVLSTDSATARPLVEDDRMKVLTFTGSAEVGWGLKARAVRKLVALELGGNAAAVVERDVDPVAAARRIAPAAYAYAGQSCISVQRVLVHRDVYDRFRDAFVEAARTRVPTGDPADPDVVAGPLITPQDADRILQWSADAERKGARRLLGGEREGSVLSPVVLENVAHDADISCKEAFGPVALLEPFDDFEAALAAVNDSVYGLQAGVFTNDLPKVLRAWDVLEVGGIIHNDYPTYRVDHMPYGGVKESGQGREGARYAMEHLTERRLLVLNRTIPGA